MKIEIVHDSLAKKIYQLASNEDKMLIKINTFIQNRHLYYEETQTLLSKRDLKYIDPYLSKTTLSPEQTILIRKSRQKASSARVAFIAVRVLSLVAIIAGIIWGVTTTIKLLRTKALEEKKLAYAEKLYKQRQQDENTKIATLNKTNLTEQNIGVQDTILLRMLIARYDTVQQQQLEDEKLRNRAQSATLSNLAATALSQKDKGAALQLVEKALKLNEKNSQALLVLAELSNADLSDFVKQETKDIISQTRKKIKTGTLEVENMLAIFSEDNEVGSKKNKTVEQAIGDASKRVRPNEQQPIAKPKMLKDLKKAPNQHPPIATKPPTPPTAGGGSRIENMPTMPTPNLEPIVGTAISNQSNTNLPCAFVQQQTSKWTDLDNNRTAFRYSSSQLLEFQLRKETIAPVEIRLMLENGKQIIFSDLQKTVVDKKIQLSCPISTAQKTVLQQNAIKEIILVLPKDKTATIELTTNGLLTLQKATTCFLQ